MRVFYDHQAFVMQSHGGISRYFCEIASRLPALGCEVQVIAPLHSNKHLHAVQSIDLIGTYVPPLRFTAATRRALNRILSAALLKRRADKGVLHQTYYQTDMRVRAGKRIVTVYDMIHERFPRDFKTRDSTPAIKPIAVAHADHVICISESTRKDLIDMFGVPREKTSVIYLASDFERTAIRTQTRTGPPYLAYVGLRGGYKNFSTLLEAYAGSRELNTTFDLVCFGGRAFTQAEQKAIAASGLQKRVRQLSGDDSELKQHYANAELFVYPSLYEGFGIPPLEAMTLGCPVACANTSSLPEVVGDAAELFDPHNVESLTAALHRALKPARRSELIERGHARVKEFSWDRCARETLKVYKMVSDA